MKMKKVKNLDSQGIRDEIERMVGDEQDDSMGESSSDDGDITQEFTDKKQVRYNNSSTNIILKPPSMFINFLIKRLGAKGKGSYKKWNLPFLV